MTVVLPTPFHYEAVTDSEKLVISLPQRRNLLIKGLITVWFGIAGLMGLTMFMVISSLTIGMSGIYLIAVLYTGQWVNSDLSFYGCLDVLVLPFLIFIFICLGKVLHIYLWLCFGSEIVTVDKHGLSLHFALPRLTRPRDFKLTSIKGLSVEPIAISPGSSFKKLFKPIEEARGIIRLNVGKQTVCFGNDIDEAEARQILRLIAQRFPDYPVHLEINPS
jgi:hypothetical protein